MSKRRRSPVSTSFAGGNGPGAGAAIDAGGREPAWSIGDLARELAITTRTIRFYESRGLLSAQRRVGGTRTYGRRERARLILILRGKDLGFSLDEIAEYLALYDADPTQQAQIRHLLAKVEDAIAGLQQKRANLDRTLRELKDIRDKAAAAVAREE